MIHTLLRPLHQFFCLGTMTMAAAMLAACGGGGGGGGSATNLSFDTSAVAVADPGSSLPTDWRDGPFMEIFVRAYKDSNGDGVGDLQGLISKLDYLQALGIKGIWLMPIYPNQDGDHGYAVTDYRNVASDYGSLADLDALLAAAHARGIGVILDYVMNHSAAQHPAFQSAKSAADNSYRDWYVWQANHPSAWSIYGSDPWKQSATGYYFAGFWDQMPDFNLKNATVAQWHRDNLRFWLNRGVDGLRFDAVGNLVENGPSAWEHQPENHTLMAAVKTLANGYSQRYIVCEAPSLPQRYAQTDSCGASFAFGYQNDLVSTVNADASKVAAIASYWSTAPDGMAGFASNHDSFAGQRLYDQFGGDTAKMKLAAATYLLQARTPFIYYGEEVGMAGAGSLSGDPKLRTPMSWSSAASGFTSGTPFRALAANAASANVAQQDGVAGSMLEHYKSLIALRNNNPALQRGSYAGATTSGLLMSFQRDIAGSGNQRVVVAYNYGNSSGSIAVTGLPANVSMTGLGPSSGSTLSVDGSGNASMTVGPQSYAVFRYTYP